MPRGGLVVPPRLRVPLTLWALFLLQTAVVARWPRFFLDTFVDDVVGRLRASLEPRLPGLHTAAGVAARLGARELLVPLALSAGAVLGWRRRSLVPPVLLAGSYFLVAAVTGLIKTALSRPQPLPLPGIPGRAFPSGHAAQAVVVFSALALLSVAGHTPEWQRRVFTVVATVVGVVSLALLWRQAHWLTDMVGGVTLGLACLTTVDASLRVRTASRSPVASAP